MKKLCTLALLAALTGCSEQPAEQTLNVYSWSEYIPDELVQEFSRETGIKVNYSTYESNEAMYAKISLLKGEGYDVVFPSTYYVAKMAKAGLVQPIDQSRLTNLANIDPALLNKAYDPNNKFSLPFMWGSTGIAVDTAVIDAAEITSWNSLWDAKYQGKLQLSDDVREVFQLALMALGHDGNSQNPAEIEAAFNHLKALMPNVRSFNSDAQHAGFLNGDISLGVVWAAEAVRANSEKPSVQYLFPQEGAIFWIDCMVIPSGAKNADAAHKFIDFLLRPDVAKRMVENTGYSTTNLAARPLLDEATRNNPAIFPPPEVMAKGQFQNDISDEATALYEKYFELLKVGAQ